MKILLQKNFIVIIFSLLLFPFPRIKTQGVVVNPRLNFLSKSISCYLGILLYGPLTIKKTSLDGSLAELKIDGSANIIVKETTKDYSEGTVKIITYRDLHQTLTLKENILTNYAYWFIPTLIYYTTNPPSINGWEIGNLWVKGEVDHLTLLLSGQGTIHASGKVNSLTINLSGIGNIQAQHLYAKNNKATLSGQGHIYLTMQEKEEVNASSDNQEKNFTKLTISLAGIGSITATGYVNQVRVKNINPQGRLYLNKLRYENLEDLTIH